MNMEITWLQILKWQKNKKCLTISWYQNFYIAWKTVESFEKVVPCFHPWNVPFRIILDVYLHNNKWNPSFWNFLCLELAYFSFERIWIWGATKKSYFRLFIKGRAILWFFHLFCFVILTYLSLVWYWLSKGSPSLTSEHDVLLSSLGFYIYNIIYI